MSDEIIKLMLSNRNGSLATVDHNCKPKVRTMQIADVFEKKIFFFSNTEKAVFKQIEQEPMVEFNILLDLLSSLRIRGTAKIETSISLKKTLLEKNPLVKGIYKSADNPILALFYLDSVEILHFDLSNGKPKTTIHSL